jgi:hypothetical protein
MSNKYLNLALVSVFLEVDNPEKETSLPLAV